MGLKPRAAAGYSGTPLAKKLGIFDGYSVATVRAPDHFAALLAPIPEGVTFHTGARTSHDVIVMFTKSRTEFANELPALSKHIGRGGLWIAWPKRASKVPTDMTEDVVREVALPMGLVDIKVCAIDETWSGLRLTWRRK